jgi:shikimate kinase
MRQALLTAKEFDAHVQNSTCRLSFIGMSNGGKSYRARVLRDQCNFLMYSVDDQIIKELGFKDMDEISTWMGYPSSSGYAEREAQYLELEGLFTKQAAMKTHGRNLVFDTTGSIAQLDKKVLAALDEHTLIVHLDVGEDALPVLMERFFKEPKPVAWGDYFTMQPGESEEVALRRSYPTLLNERLARYRTLAHVNIPAKKLYDATGTETLAVIRAHL